MRNTIMLICFIILSFLQNPIISQEKTNQKMIYIHKEKASFKSKALQKIASIFRVKN